MLTLFTGMLIMTISLLIIGILSLFGDRGKSVVQAQIAFMAIWSFTYQGSIGAVGYAMIAEVPTSSLRGVTQSMATVVNGVFNLVWAFSTPYMVNPDEGNMGGKVAFVFFAMLFIFDIFVFFYYPETNVSDSSNHIVNVTKNEQNRSFAEIDELFARKISPRHFARTVL